MIPQAINNSQIVELNSPMEITIAGQARIFTSVDGIFDAIRGLENEEKSLNRKVARTVFHLGRALLDVQKKLRYGQITHLYNDVGIHRRRAQRAVRFAHEYATAEGEFDIEKYRLGEEAARNKHDRGEDRCSFDTQGHPSLTAVERASGLRSSNGKTEPSPPVATEPVTHEPVSLDPMSLISQAADEYREASPEPSLKISSGWSVGDQIEIDYDLLASERQLASVIEDADRLLKQGRLSNEQGIEIERAMDALTKHVQQMTETTETKSNIRG